MTFVERKKILDLITEYGHCLERVKAEKEMMKTIEQRAKLEAGQPTKAFKVVATAYWRDEVRMARDALEWQMDLFDEVSGMTPEARVVVEKEVSA